MDLYKSKPYEADSGGEDSDDTKPAKRSGRRKIKIEYIEDKNRRHITFSKRKAGIMKKVTEKDEQEQPCTHDTLVSM
jgi:hypothetical protein